MLSTVPFLFFQSLTSRSAQLKADEARKAYVLLSITMLFIVCHSVRFILGIHECISVREYQRGVREHCNPSPLWVMVLQARRKGGDNTNPLET